MEYISYYEEIVSKRESCRNFKDEKVDASILAEIKDYYNEEDRLLPDIKTEIAIYDKASFEAVGKAAGYKGFLIAAPHYLVIFSGDGDHALENAGFIGQGITLKMTQLGLAACWLTVNDPKAVKDAVKADTDKNVAAVIAFGYRDKDNEETRLDIKTPSDVKVVKVGTKAAPKIDLSTLLFDKKYGRVPNVDSMPTEVVDALRAIASAQSFFNRQPYRVIVDDDLISLIGLQDEMTCEADEHLNYGIAMFNFYAVLSAVRNKPSQWSFEEPDRDLGYPANSKFVAACRI
ncbi:MAG: nitroreductase family protein [Anaerovoracaceae bacterium]|jgi:hypothetical protein